MQFQAINPVEVWARRHLVLMLAVRDIKARYKQSALGWLWAVIRPLALVVVFSYLFGAVADLPTGGVPYPIYVFAALLGWDLFANVVQGCASSVTSHRVIVERAYCPRVLFPLVAVLVSLFDWAISAALFALMCVYFGVAPSAPIMWLPVLLLATILTGLSMGLWLAAIAVWLRDVRYVVNYLIQVVMLLTPVGYGAANVPEAFSFLLTLNPMAVLVETYRWCLLGLPMPAADAIIMASVGVSALLVGGLFFFNALERSFADVI